MNKYYEIRTNISTNKSALKKHLVRVNIKYLDQEFQTRIFYINDDKQVVLKNTLLSLFFGEHFKKLKRLIFTNKRKKPFFNLLKTSKFYFASMKEAKQFESSIQKQLTKLLNEEITYHQSFMKKHG